MTMNDAGMTKGLPLAGLLWVSTLSFVNVAEADTLTMKNGTVLQGTYAGGNETTVSFTADMGTAAIETKNLASLSFTGPAPAAATGGTDALTLKSGNVLQGTYKGGSAKTVKFVSPLGALELKTNEIKSLSFSGTPAAAAPSAAAGAAPAPVAAPSAAAAAAPMTIPAGTTLRVRTVDLVSSTDAPGRLFGLVLDSDLRVNDKLAAKAGTKLYGKVEQSAQAGRVAGKSNLAVALESMEIRGSRVPVSSDAQVSTGKGSMQKTARRALVGTAIGGAVGGSKGAARGAGAGAATTLVTKGEAVTIPPNTLLQFSLEAPLTIPGG